MMTKVVNGVRIEMTPKEERAHIAAHPPIIPVPPPPSETDIIRETLKAKNIITDADLAATRTAMKG